jgi:hypothetical protein
MKRKPTEFEFISFVYNIGFHYYESGIMRNKDNSKAGMYLKGDFITDEQKQKLVDKFGNWVGFFKAQLQAAPESIKPIIMLKSQKEYDKMF